MNSIKHAVGGGVFALVLCAGACGGSSNSVTGTVGGQSFDAQDAVFLTGGSSTTGTIVGMSSFGALCNAATIDQLPKNSHVLSFQLTDAGNVVSAPGTFQPIGTTGATQVFGGSWASYDATCNPTNTSATGGTVTVTAVSATRMAGTFDVMFGTSHVTGSFDAASCPTPTGNTSGPTCI